MKNYEIKAASKRLILIGALSTALAGGVPSAHAQEVVLNPGFISGVVQVGSEIINQAAIFAGFPPFGSSTTISPNAPSGSYTLIVNVPEGTTPTYSVTASNVRMDSGRDRLDFATQQVPVTEFQTSTADFVLADPGFIEVRFTVTGGTLSSASLSAIALPNTNSTTSSLAPPSGNFLFPVVPNTEIRIAGSVVFTNARNLSLPARFVDVDPGQTVVVDYELTAPPTPATGGIAGNIQMPGPAILTSHQIFAEGPSGRSQVVPTDGLYALLDLSEGKYRMRATSRFNGFDDVFRHPLSSFSPTLRPLVTAGSVTTVDIFVEQAFIDGNIALTGTASFSDVSLSRITVIEDDTRTTRGSGTDEVNLATGDYDLVVSAGSWKPSFIRFRFSGNYPSNQLDETLNFVDDIGSANPISVAAGETAFRDFTLPTGGVTISFSVTGGGTLSDPELQGNCVNTDEFDQVVWSYNFDASGRGQNNVPVGTVNMVGMEGTCTNVRARALVGGSLVTFGRITFDVVPGATQVIDIGGPTLTVQFPEPDLITSNPTITVTGLATDDVAVASVTVNGVAAALVSTGNSADLAEVSFSATIPLDRGPNEIVTVATDTADPPKTGSDTRTVFRDEGEPALAFTPVDGAFTSEFIVAVEGTADDDAGIASITVEGVEVAFESTGNPDAPNEVSFTTDVNLDLGENFIEAVVTDISNRRTAQTHRVTVVPNQPALADAGADQTIECTSPDATQITLNGAGSTDPDDDPLAFTWTGRFPEGGGSVIGVSPTVTLPLGTTEVALVANDGTVDSQPDTVSVTVTVGVAGLLPPLTTLVPDGTEDVPMPDKAFKAGRTLPLRLHQSCGATALTDADVAAPQIVRLVKTGEALDLPLTDPDAGDANDTGTFFRYSDPNWVFNLSTKTLGLSPGTYEITIRMPDGQLYTTSFVLK